MADKDKQPKQADFDKAWENIKAGKTMPSENDMGPLPAKKKGGMIKKYSKGGTASARADGCAVKGKTKGRII